MFKAIDGQIWFTEGPLGAPDPQRTYKRWVPTGIQTDAPVPGTTEVAIGLGSASAGDWFALACKKPGVNGGIVYTFWAPEQFGEANPPTELSPGPVTTGATPAIVIHWTDVNDAFAAIIATDLTGDIFIRQGDLGSPLPIGQSPWT